MAKKQDIKPAAATTGVTPPPTPETAPTEMSTPATPPAVPETKKGAKNKAKPKPKPAPRRKQGVWGIDLGQCSLKAIRLEEIDGVVQVTAFDYIEHPKILSQPDADKDALIREALEKFLANNNHCKGDIVAISVPGQSALARFVKLPPVQQDKIHDIVKFEAKQQIPFNLDEVIWDYQKVGEGSVVEGFAMDTEIGLFAMKRDAINIQLQHFKDVGVEVDIVQIAPLALCNYLTYDTLGHTPGEEKPAVTNCVVALDMGADSTNLVITDGSRIIWQKVISTGGNHFTRALTKDLKLTFAKAEHTKRNAAKSPDLKKILAALKPVLNDFEGELKRSLNYFQNSHRSAELKLIVGMGNAFKLPGLQKFLEEKLGIPVKRLQKFERLKGDPVLTAPTFHENLGTFSTAYGLAVQGLKKARLVTNLLPPELRTERQIRAKKPWAAAAAALLLVGLGACALRYALDYRAYGDPGVVQAVTAAKNVVTAAGTVERAFKDEKDKALAEEEGVKSVVAGQREHLNWLDMMSFLSNVIPHPDGMNLPPDAVPTYFRNAPDLKARGAGAMSGAAAYRLWLQRQGSLKMATVPMENPLGPGGPGKPPGPGPGPGIPPATGPAAAAGEDDLGPGIDDLVQFNIEGVEFRYCPNLEAFWKEMKKKVPNPGDYRPVAANTKPPSDLLGANKGWVVEMRGYTFHNRKKQFILDTLCQNIARMGGPDLNKTPPMPMNPMGQPVVGEPQAGKPAIPDKGPVLNHVGCVVLYPPTTEKTSETTNLKVAGQSVLDGILKEAMAAVAETGGVQGGNTNPGGGPPKAGGVGVAPPGAPGGPGVGGSGGTAANGRDSWVPLGSTGSSSGSGFGAGAGAGKPPGGFAPPPAGNTTGGPGAGPTATTNSKHERTEFVIFFVWIEPTPSDALRGQVEEATQTMDAGK